MPCSDHSAKKQLLHQNKHKKSDLFADAHRDNNHHFWTHVLRPGETKVNLFVHNARCYIWRTNRGTCTILPLKFGGGIIMVLGYCAAGGTGALHEIDDIMRREHYVEILNQHLKKSARK